MSNVTYKDPNEINLRVVENPSAGEDGPKWIYYSVDKETAIGSGNALKVEITDDSIVEIPVKITAKSEHQVKGTNPTSGWHPAGFDHTITYTVTVKDEINHAFACNIRKNGSEGDGEPVDPLFRLKKTGG